MKQAAFIGNSHAAARVTPFFDTHVEVAEFAKNSGIDYSFIRPIGNWKEHQVWNAQRVGFYATNQIVEQVAA